MKKKLPLYELRINPEKDSMVFAVSLVKEPAIRRNFLAFNEVKPLSFALNEEKRELLGAAIVPNEPIFRRDKKTGREYEVFFTKELIREIAQNFFKMGFQNKINLNHSSTSADSFIFQAFIVDEALGVNSPKGTDAPDGSLILGMKVESPEVWEDAKNGNIQGFSIEGLFELLEVDSIEENMEMESVKTLFKFSNNITSSNKQNEMELEKELGQLVLKGIRDVSKLYFDKLYTSDEIKIAAKEVGSKVETIQADGTPAPAPDGHYPMEDGFAFTVKDGVIASIDGQEAAKKDEVVAEEAPAEEKPKEESSTDDLKMRIEAVEAQLAELLSMLKGVEAQKMESVKQFEQLNATLKEISDKTTQVLEKRIPQQFSQTNKQYEVKEDNNSKVFDAIQLLASLKK